MEIDREEVQKIAIEAENLQRMQRALKDQIVSLNMAALEASVTINSLEKIKGGDKSLVSLGSGVFSSATIKSADTVVFDVGAGIYAEYPSQKAVDILKGRIEEIKGITKKLDEDMRRVQSSLIELEGRARRFIK